MTINPLRPLTDEEQNWLERISRSYSEPAAHVTRAKEILAVTAGSTYQEAAEKASRKSGDAVSQLVGRFNQEGMLAIQGHPGGKPPAKYQASERERVLAEVRRQPDAEKDGTNSWSLTTLQKALRNAEDGLPEISTERIWVFLRDAHGVMPLHTPLGGSWLNMAESIQRISRAKPGDAGTDNSLVGSSCPCLEFGSNSQ